MEFIKSKTTKFILKLAITVILIYLLFRFIGIEKVYNELSNVNLYYIFLSLLFTFPLIFFKALRWKGIVGIFNKSLKIGPSIVYTLISIAFALVTPSRLGEFIKVKYLVDKTRVTYLVSFITVVVDKVFDIIAMIFLALLSFSLIELFSRWKNIFIVSFFVYLLILILVFIYFEKVLAIVPYLLPKKYQEGFKRIAITKIIYLKSIIISLIIWLILGVQSFIIFYSLGIKMPLLITLGGISLMALSAMVPISIGGIGIRELIAISFFSIMGINAEKSAVFSLMYTFVTSGIPAITGAFLYMLLKKKSSL